jgi:hypothetical protein
MIERGKVPEIQIGIFSGREICFTLNSIMTLNMSWKHLFLWYRLLIVTPLLPFMLLQSVWIFTGSAKRTRCLKEVSDSLPGMTSSLL